MFVFSWFFIGFSSLDRDGGSRYLDYYVGFLLDGWVGGGGIIRVFFLGCEFYMVVIMFEFCFLF